MAAIPDTAPPRTGADPPGPDFTPFYLDQIEIAIGMLAESGQSLSEAELIDQIARIESLQNELAALQSSRIRAFGRAHVAARTASGVVEPERLERSISAQIGLACRVSPTVGRTRLRTARDLHDGLDHVRGLHSAGDLNADKVRAVVTATSHLGTEERSEVDRRLAERDIARLGLGRLRDLARGLAAEVAPVKFLARTAAARTGRRVTVRPAADGMADLTAHLPVEQAVACYAALRKAFNDVQVNPAPLTRSRSQVMADTLVERLTGQVTAGAVNVEVQIVVPVEALVDPTSPLPAEIPGYGPVPADLIATAAGKTAWRRLVTRDGIVIGGSSRQRNFTGQLAELVRARDGNRCAEPYCDAPARQIDHIHRAADHGMTSFENSRGICQFHNLVREDAGWRVERNPEGTVRTTTPTGNAVKLSCGAQFDRGWFAMANAGVAGVSAGVVAVA